MAQPGATALSLRSGAPRLQPAGFTLVSLVLLTAEFYSWSNATGARSSNTTLVFSVAMCAALMLTGYFPALGGIAFVVISAITSGIGVPVALPTLGLYAILALWISKGWFRAALVALAIAGGAEIGFSETTSATAIGVLTASAFAVPAGLLARHAAARIERERLRSEQFRMKAELTAAAVSEELARNLHDSVMRDLVRISLLSRAALRDSPEFQRLSQIQRLSLEAMTKVRELGSSTTASGLGEFKALPDVIEECRTILESRRIVLKGDMTCLKSAQLGNASRMTLNVALLEACTNILKYAPEATTATIDSSVEDGFLSVVIANAIDDAVVDPGPLSGSLGLASLSSEAAERGGKLYYWRVSDRWVLALYLPVVLSGEEA